MKLVVAQLRPPEADVLRGPPAPSLCVVARHSPSQVTFSTAWDFSFLVGAVVRSWAGFPAFPMLTGSLAQLGLMGERAKILAAFPAIS